MNSYRNTAKISLIAPIGLCIVAAIFLSLAGCGAAESVYHDGNFSADQKAAAQAEYQSVEDEESQGSNKKKKKAGQK